jgi:hypothetical protein
VTFLGMGIARALCRANGLDADAGSPKGASARDLAAWC